MTQADLDVQACRVELARRAALSTFTISGQTYKVRSLDGPRRAAPNCPEVRVFEWTTLYDQAMGRGLDEHMVTLYVYAAPVANDRVGSQILNAMLRADGAGSLRAQLTGYPTVDRTLGGLCQAMNVVDSEAYGVYGVGADDYIGATLRLKVR